MDAVYAPYVQSSLNALDGIDIEQPQLWRQTAERYRDLLGSAVAANMNMLRVWGGGQFEHPAFYELCDEMGVMLWHDFMFSCATYPGDEHFLAGVRKEIAHQLRNLRDHACIALWCGDNECIGAAKWFDRDEKVRAQNIQLCVARAKELEKLCATYDPTRCFWPSSPCLGPGNYGDGWKDDSSGDMHFWQVWFGDKPFSHYFSVRPRFCSEFGFQSYPTKEEALTFVTPDQLNPTAPDFAYHQKCCATSASPRAWTPCCTSRRSSRRWRSARRWKRGGTCSRAAWASSTGS